MSGATGFDVFWVLLAGGSLVASALLGQDGFFRRTFSVIAVLFGATLLVSGMLRLIPGDPVENILGDQAPQEARVQLSYDLGLTDENGDEVGFVAQYAKFFRGIASASVHAVLPESAGAQIDELVGPELLSFRSRTPVRKLIGARLAKTAWLALLSMIIALLLGPLLGILAAAREGTVIDALAMAFAIIFVAVPRFWLGPMLILVFAIGFRWFPVSGAQSAAGYILPAICLGTALAAVLARFCRASLLEVKRQDYVRTARAKGLTERVVIVRHALRNALIPVLTIVGLQFGAVLAGAVVTEKIFVFPGVGLLLFENIMRLDLPVVQGCVLLIAFAYVMANVLTDVMYRVVDPRLRASGKGGAS